METRQAQDSSMSPAVVAEDNGGALVGTAAVLLALTWLSVGLRTYVRAWMTNGFKADDVLMLVAQAIFTVSCAFILRGVAVGLGHHDKALPQRQEIDALMWQALATATYVIDMMFIKLSLGIFLLRFSVQRRYKHILYVTLTVVTIWSSVLFIWDLFQCNPVQAQWDYTILDNNPNAHCVTSDQVVAAAYSLSVLSIITDWLFAILPMFMVWNVKMTRQAKLTVSVILGLGVFASVATLIRLKFLADLNDVDDILFAGTDAMVWTLIEPGVAIIASSLVTIRPLLQRLRLRGFESTPRTGSKGLQSSGRRGPGGGRSAGRSAGHSAASPGELTLIDLETGDRYGKEPDPPAPAKDRTRLSTLAMPRKPLGSTTVVGHGSPFSDTDESHLSPVRSETYVIEGDRISDHGAGGYRHGSAGSDTDEIAGLEAHSQDIARPDLGRGGR